MSKRNIDSDPAAQLIERIGQGDRAALKEFFDSYAGPLHALVLAATTHEVADGLVIEIFDEIWQKAGKFDAETDRSRDWLKSIVRDVVSRYLRSQQ